MLNIYMRIEKKVWPQYFEKILTGEKKFEVRLADYDYKKGDALVLREWDPEKKVYTGRAVEKKITYLAKTKDMKFWTEDQVLEKGFVIMGIE